MIEFGSFGGRIQSVTVSHGKQIKLETTTAHLSGYATRFNKLHHISTERDGLFAQILSPGAFDASLKSKPRIRFLIDHDPDLEVGSTDDELTVSADKDALTFDLELKGAGGLQGVVRSMQRKQMSVGITYDNTGWATMHGARVLVVHDAHLHEISIVRDGAVDGTFASLAHRAIAGRADLDCEFAAHQVRVALDHLGRRFG